MAYSKKYTNADFYKDGKFQQDVAMEAMKDMFAFYDVPFTELMAKDMWVTDFGLGDFENVGMGGIFWINDPEYKYFAHAIYLLSLIHIYSFECRSRPLYSRKRIG